MPSNPFSGRFSGGALSNSGKPDRAHQRGVGFQRKLRASPPGTGPGFVNGDAAQQCLAAAQLVTELAGNVLQNADGFARDFRADAVAGHNQNV